MTLDDYEQQFRLVVKEKDRLYKVLEVNAIISSSLNLQVVLDTLMGKAKEVMESEASSLMLVDEEAQELYFYTVKGEKSDAIKTIRLKMGEGISGWVASKGEPVLVEDAAQDPRFSRKADQKSQFHTKSMMCVPLRAKKRILGTVQVLNKLDGTFFNMADLKIFEVLADQAAIAIENARLHEMATVDQVTGLYLKHYFLARLEEEYKRARLSGQPMAVIMSDIDLFKKVNDNFGHQGGDRALVELAAVIKDTVKEKGSVDDIPGRYGGEEFCVLLPDTDSQRALEMAEHIRRNIESHPIQIGEKTAKITISVGVACYPFHAQYIKDKEDFIKLADEALYICKHRGRNCVALYEEIKPDPEPENNAFQITRL